MRLPRRRVPSAMPSGESRGGWKEGMRISALTTETAFRTTSSRELASRMSLNLTPSGGASPDPTFSGVVKARIGTWPLRWYEGGTQPSPTKRPHFVRLSRSRIPGTRQGRSPDQFSRKSSRPRRLELFRRYLTVLEVPGRCSPCSRHELDGDFGAVRLALWIGLPRDRGLRVTHLAFWGRTRSCCASRAH